MSKASMEPASKAELKNLMAVLGMNRKQFAQLCAASANTVGWWLKEEQVPAFRFERVARKLGERFPDPSKRTDEQKAAIALVERILKAPLAVIMAEGSAKSGDSKSAFLDNHMNKEEPSETKPNQNRELSKLPLEDLINEIARRGYRVQLEPKE